MKIFGILTILLSCCAGCATSVTILGGKVTAADDHTVKVELVTKEDPQRYVDSYWATKVYLYYQPEKMDITTTSSEYKPIIREFVFGVTPTSVAKEQGTEERYLSVWKIPRKGHFAWSFTDYDYAIQPGDKIRVRLSGGTMHFTSLGSNELILKVPSQQPKNNAKDASH